MDEKTRLSFLEARVEFLEKEKTETIKALENVLEVDDLNISLNKLDNADIIIERAFRKIARLVKVKYAGFLLVDESSGHFTPCWFSPEDCREIIMAETDKLIMDNTFALVIKANRCITVKSKQLKGTLVVHALSTISRTRGMFICLLDMNKEDIPDAVFSLITIVMNSCAHLLESFELYNRNRQSNELLAKSVERLEHSEMHLKSFNEKLESEVESRTKELKATNELLENEISERKKIEKLLTQQKEVLENLNETLENRVKVETENRRKSEQVMHEQSKLAAMGHMLEAISHQWRQPLNSLGMIVQDVLDEYEENGVTKEYLEETVGKAVKLILHMSSTIDDFCNLVSSDGANENFTVFNAVKEVASLLEENYNDSGIFIDIDKSGISETERNVIVKGDSGMFKQVVMNIMSNCKDAICEKLDSGKMSRGNIVIKPYIRENQFITEISDNGGGIPDEILERVFEPYFTTKVSSKGTGVGLYMAKIFIEERMSGSIDVSNKGDGATVTLSLSIDS